jgi:hypothetical protein
VLDLDDFENGDLASRLVSEQVEDKALAVADVNGEEIWAHVWQWAHVKRSGRTDVHLAVAGAQLLHAAPVHVYDLWGQLSVKACVCLKPIEGAALAEVDLHDAKCNGGVSQYQHYTTWSE